MIASDLAPSTEAEEYVDNSDLRGSVFPGRYHVWIHADKVFDKDAGELLGVFVIYTLHKLDDDFAIPPAI